MVPPCRSGETPVLSSRLFFLPLCTVSFLHCLDESSLIRQSRIVVGLSTGLLFCAFLRSLWYLVQSLLEFVLCALAWARFCYLLMRFTWRVTHGWLKCSDVNFETTGLSRMYIHLDLNDDHSSSTGVWISNICRNSCTKDVMSCMIVKVIKTEDKWIWKKWNTVR